uniref:MyoD family inhibitor domain containing n=1 Tax=Propithecus coquereli TaxID=379532 RepID=A0A2K6EG31_PROCO
MSGAGEAVAPRPAGPQRAAEAGGGRLGAPAQGLFSSCVLIRSRTGAAL